jgi:hypothetical protein
MTTATIPAWAGTAWVGWIARRGERWRAVAGHDDHAVCLAALLALPDVGRQTARCVLPAGAHPTQRRRR